MLRYFLLSAFIVICFPVWSLADTCKSVTGGMVVLTTATACQNTKSQYWQEQEQDHKVIFYSKMPHHKRVSHRNVGKPCDPVVHLAANQTNMDFRLIQAVIQVESAGNPDAVSPAGAIGLMQIMPETASDLRIDPYDSRENVIGGATYLSQMLQQFGQLKLALAAYNAGPGAVNRYGGIPPYPETIRYVENVLKTYDLLKLKTR